MEIGARLKEAREAKNLSLNDIQKITKIQTRYLQAIENGNFDIMPGNFYVRAFIKEYAFAVELDPEQLFEEHSEELPSNSDESSIDYTRVQRSRKDTSTTRNPAIFSFLPTVIVILLIVGILFMVWYFQQDGSFFDSDEPTEQIDDNGSDQVKLPSSDGDENSDNASNEVKENDGEQNQSKSKSDLEKDDTNDGEEEPNEQEQQELIEPTLEFVEYKNEQSTYDLINPNDEIKVVLSTSNKNWVEIENGKGKRFYYEMLTEDKAPVELDLTGEEQLYLKFGNPTSITITINDETLKLSDDITPTEVQKVWINVKNNAE